MPGRRVSRWVAAGAAVVSLLAAAAVVLGSATPASADSSYLEFSTNGTTWSSTAPSALFANHLLLAPGDSLASTVYIRSTRADPTSLSVAIANLSTSDPRFSAEVTIGATGGVGSGLSTPLSDLPACAPILSAFPVARNQAVPVTITLALANALSGVQGQGSWVRFDLQVGLSDLGSPVNPNGCPASSTSVPAFDGGGSSGIASSRMAFTGTTTLYPGLTIAGIVVGLGGLFLLAGRRRRGGKP